MKGILAGDQTTTRPAVSENEEAVRCRFRIVRFQTVKSPALITLTIGDDPALAGYVLLKAANDDRAVRASMLLQANGQRILYNHTIAIGVVPSLDTNKVMSVNASLALKGDPVRYAT